MEIEPPVILMVMDMQNDFCSREGAFARAGFSVEGIEAIIPTIKTVVETCAEARIPIVATRLTILEDLDGKAMGMGHLRTLRPFLVEAGFRAGTWGHEGIPELPEPDYPVRKWGYSAIYQTELEKILTALGGKTLIFTGIATNGVVEGTARDANMRGFEIVTLSDCVAGYNPKLHEASLLNLGNIGTVVPSADFLAAVPELAG